MPVGRLLRDGDVDDLRAGRWTGPRWSDYRVERYMREAEIT
ncbi:hypothetical protein [Mycolicibacterium sp.]|nr:hypothetical protein [Mycolicibacterium sp.]